MPRLRGVVLLLLGVAATSGPAPAREAPALDHAEDGGWRFRPALRVQTEFDDNVFLLDPGKKSDLAAITSDDRASGRFTNMEGASDIVTALEAVAQFKGPGLLDRSLTLTPEVRYELYAQNSERSNAHLAFTAEQDLPKGARSRLQGRFTPEYFSKNYLADAADADSSGTITPDERIYTAGTFSESEVSLDYRFRLVKGEKDRPFGAKMRLASGYYDRSYQAPFQGRGLGGPTAGVGVRMDFHRRTSVDLDYGIAALSSTPTSQVLLLDEPDFNLDFNGNGSANDLDVRTVQTVDRSRVEHVLGAILGLELSSTSDVELRYEHRIRDHLSEEPFDVVNRGRRDTRDAVEIGLSLRVAPRVRLVFEGELTKQVTNRPDTAAFNEIDDYTRNRVSAGLAYR